MEDLTVQAPPVMEDEVLQVLEVCKAMEEIKQIIVTTVDEDSISNSPQAVASPVPGSKLSQVMFDKRQVSTSAVCVFTIVCDETCA